MLKGLKKGSKKQTKVETTKEKKPKTAKAAGEQQEQEPQQALVDIDYDKKQTETVKVAPKKVQTGKLEQRQIDTANIKIQKVEEKKKITSWVVDEKDISKVAQRDFNYKQVQTEFQSLTDQNINAELKQKAKEQEKFKVNQPITEGGLKFAPLQNSNSRADPEINVVKKATTSPIVGIPIAATNLNFTNSSGGMGNFAPLQRSKQEVQAEQISSRRRQEQEIVASTKSKTSWIGMGKKEQPAQVQFKVSGWAAKAEQVVPGGVKFAPIQTKGGNNYGRQEQEFKYSSKKEQEERRKAREEAEKAGKQ